MIWSTCRNNTQLNYGKMNLCKEHQIEVIFAHYKKCKNLGDLGEKIDGHINTLKNLRFADWATEDQLNDVRDYACWPWSSINLWRKVRFKFSQDSMERSNYKIKIEEPQPTLKLGKEEDLDGMRGKIENKENWMNFSPWPIFEWQRNEARRLKTLKRMNQNLNARNIILNQKLFKKLRLFIAR